MPVLEREEYIEQAYFFHSFRDRLVDGLPAQEILARISEELLSTTKLPLAVSFLSAEIRGTGLMAPAMARISHYFTAYQTHVINQAEIAMSRFSMEQALLILEREAKYKSEAPSLAGLFIFQFESLSRNRLGYTKGLAAMSADPFYTEDWRDYILTIQTRLGDVDFADLIFVRSSYFVDERRKNNPEFEPKYPTLFGGAKARSPGPTAAANRCISSRHSSGNSAIPKCLAPAGPMSSKPASSCSSRRLPNSRTVSRSPRASSTKMSISRRSSSNRKTPPACRRGGGRNSCVERGAWSVRSGA